MTIDIDLSGDDLSGDTTAPGRAIAEVLGRGAHDPVDLDTLPEATRAALTALLSAEYGLGPGHHPPPGVMTPLAIAAWAEDLALAEMDAMFGDGEDEPPAAGTVHELIAAQAHRTPDAVALIFDGAHVTYAELTARATRLARVLRRDGIGRGDVVSVHVPRGVGLVVSLLAVLEAGAAFTVLDTAFPAERLREVTRLAGSRAIISEGPPPEGLATPGVLVFAHTDGADDDVATAETAGPADTACVIFTSGSTGRPKGVLSTHWSLAATLTGQDYAAFGPGEVWLQCSPVSWDAFLLELFGPLVSGGTCVLQPGQRPEPQLIAELVAAHAVTTVHVSASLLNFLIDEHPAMFAEGTTVTHLMTGGEAPSRAHLARLLAMAPGIDLVNGYSPVECMIFTAAHRIRPADLTGTVPVGRALVGKRVYVLDGDLAPVAPGVTGEVYMAGAGLAHGYAAAPATTAERFPASPYGAPGERMYRTGDLGRWNAAGELELLGRSDDQIKIRGHRVEPSGVDAALQALPGVGRTATVLREDRPGDPRLTSYAVPVPGADLDGTGLRRALARVLPDYMVPSAVVVLAELPVTPNGKLDRAALPAPVAGSGGDGTPRTQREAVLCALFAEVLGAREVGVHDGFFDLGGHSLLVTRLVARIRRVLGASVRVRDVFDHPTVAGLSRVLDASARAVAPLARRERPAVLPVSPGQRRLWFNDRFEGPSATYNIPVTVALSGDLDAAALEAAVGDLIGRHESLRTVFDDSSGELRQVVLPVPEPVPFTHRAVTPEELPGALNTAAGHVFDIAAEAPVRAELYATGAGEHTLLLLLHHIAADGLSMRPLLADLAEAYTARSRGEAPGWAPLPVQYADYTLWQREVLDGGLAEAQLAHWREALAGLPEEIRLPADRARGEHTGFGAEAEAVVDAGLHARLTERARAEHVTPFMLAQAAVAVVLHLNGAGTDIPLGTPVAGRDDEALDPLVGFFVNTVVLRTDLGGDPTLSALLARVRDTALAAYSHQDVPFERVVDELNPPRSAVRHPLFQTSVTYGRRDGESLELPGLRTEVGFAEADAGVKFDLGFAFLETPGGGLRVQVTANAGMFDTATARRLAGAVVDVLDAIAERPGLRLGELPAVTPAERERMVGDWNHTPLPEPGGSVHGLIEARADLAPDAVALVFGDTTVTYGHLDRAANRLAHHLIARGARRGDVIAVDAERGPDMVIALLAALKAGCAYLLLDPAHPAARRRAVLDASGARLLVAAGDSAGLVGPGDPRLVPGTGAEGPSHRPAVGIAPGDTAAIMFTSGSTGVPKGVAAPHRAIVATHAARSYMDHGEGDVLLQCSPVSWDAFALEVFSALFHGGICVLQPGQSPDLALIEELGERHGVTHLQLSTSLFNAMVDENSPALGRAAHVMIGGEAASPAHVARALAAHPGMRLTNGYGPVESLGFTTAHDVTGDETGAIPIGRPIAHKRAYVLDARLRPVAPNVHGELYVSGAGIAHGYLGGPGATSERFLPDPFGPPGARMYRTGDLAYWNGEGVLMFAGRADDQVKIRGFRVEPGEVEAALHRLPGVARAAVAVRDGRLIGYVVPSGADLDTAALREGLALVLPEHMVPAAVVAVDDLPLTGNGKLDRAALPEPPAPRPTGEGETPRTPAERTVAEVWEQVLGVRGLGVHDNFFALGGDSIAGIRVVSRLRKAGLVVTPKLLFEHQTIARLAAAARREASFDAEQGTVTGDVPFTPAQRWWLRQAPPVPGHFNQATVLAAGDMEPGPLATALDALVAHHDMLRVRCVRDGDGWRQEIPTVHPGCPVTFADLGHLPAPEREARWLELAEAAQTGMDLAGGGLVRAVLADLGPGEGRRLLLVVHHIAVDIVSWSILTEDLETAYRQAAAGRPIALPAKTTSFRSWARRLAEHAGSAAARSELDLWAEVAAPPLGLRDRRVPRRAELRMGGETAAVLLGTAPTALGVSLEDVVVAALGIALCRWSGHESVLVDVEGHGREALFEDADLSRTVGWFTSLHPVPLALPPGADAVDVVHATAARRESVPHKGVGHGVLAHLSDAETRVRVTRHRPEVVLNFHGRVTTEPGEGLRELHEVPAGTSADPRNLLPHAVSVDAEFVDGEFIARLTHRLTPAEGERLTGHLGAALREIAAHVSAGGHLKRFAAVGRADAARIAERFN